MSKNVVRRALMLVATTVLALVATLLSVAPASAAPGAPSGLTVTNPGPFPTFAWDRVKRATGYVVEASNSSGKQLFSTATVNNTYIHPQRLPTGTVNWRVGARAADGQLKWSSSEYTSDGTPAPTPLSPIAGASVTPPVEPPVLTWAPVRGAAQYQIEVASNDTFTSPKSYTTKSTSFVVPVPQGVGTYFWRVRADFGNGLLTDWSSAATYVVAELPLIEGDDVSSPSTDVPVQDVVLDWAPVRGAQKYQVQVATDNSFNEIIDNKTSVYSTRYSPGRTYPNNDYFWRVRAVNSAGEPTGWAEAPLEFQRRWSHRPTLLHPAHQATPAAADPFYYEWTPVPHAQRYRLEVGTDPDFSPGSYKVCYTASTTYTAGYITDACKPTTQGQIYYWRVLAVEPSTGAEIPSIYSDIRRFIYDSGPVTKISPSHGATVDVPTLRWEAQRDAERYTVTVRNNAGTTVASTTTFALSWTPRAALKATDGPFTWRVVAVDEMGSISPDYGPRSFSLTGVITDDPGVPALTPDASAPSARFPALSWEPYPDAAYYKIEVGVEGSLYTLPSNATPLLSNTFAYPALTDESDYFLAPETYWWRVRPYNASGAPLAAVGPASTFTITALPEPTGQRIALTGAATSGGGTSCSKKLGTTVDEESICRGVPSTPVLRWDPVPGASHYMVYLAEDRDLTQLVYGNSSTNSGIPSTENTMWTPSSAMGPQALPDNESGEAYFWYIRPCKATGRCSADPLNTDDAATNAFRKIAPKVELLTPAADALVPNQVTFTWRDYLVTNQAVKFPPTATGAPSSHLTADRYRIQVFTSPTAGQPIDDQFVDQTTYTPWDRTYPEGDLWWRVQATDAAGNGLAWSDLRKVRHETPYQNLNKDETLATGTEGPLDTGVRPALNARVSGDVALRWTARDYDASWNIQIFRNDDTTGSPANQVYSGVTQQAAFTWTSQLSASAAAYRWRIQRKDAAGKVGPWSDWGRFFVKDAPLTLLQPGSGFQKPTGTVFTWQPVAEAASYHVQVSSSNGGTNTNVVTGATAWAPTVALSTGSYTWRVIAKDATNQTVGTSAEWQFKVDGTAPTITSYSPTSAPKRKANFVVKFSERVKNVTSRTIQLKVKGRSTPLKAKVTLRKGRKAILNPATKLARGKTYTCYVRPKIRDAAGNKVAKFKWSVTTS